MAVPYKFPRGTRSAFNTLKSASGLIPYAIYYITDENSFEIATANNTSSTMVALSSKLFAVTFNINGGGAAIAAGQKVNLPSLPFAGTIQRWTITADQSGSAVVTINKATYANFPTMTAISGTEKPTLSAAQKNEDTSLTTWTTSVAQGDILQASVDSASTVQQLAITLWIQRT